MTRFYDYGVAFMTAVADPLSPVTQSFVGIRLSIIAHVEQ
jgi:hypothetical protein